MKLQHESKPPHKKPYSLYLKNSFSILAGNSCEAARAYPLKCAEAPTPGWWAWSSLPAQPGSPCHLQQANGAVRRRKEWTCTLWRGVCVCCLTILWAHGEVLVFLFGMQGCDSRGHCRNIWQLNICKLAYPLFVAKATHAWKRPYSFSHVCYTTWWNAVYQNCSGQLPQLSLGSKRLHFVVMRCTQFFLIITFATPIIITTHFNKSLLFSAHQCSAVTKRQCLQQR